jgi:glycosyltransferase involved in cell wall biosynthesis
MTGTAPSLSLCMIVKNEQSVLPRCLNSVRGLVDELIIADTGSTDATRHIAASHGARVLPFDFRVVDFAAARNHSLAQATGRWILVLDADERLDSASARLIRERIAQDENAGYYLERLNLQPDSTSRTTDYVVRLFPNRPAYRYRGRVHETVDASILAEGGRLLRTGIRIHHDFASDPEARRRRNLWYLGILNEEIAADPQDDSRLDFLAAEYHQLGMFDKAAEVTERIACMRPLDPQAHVHAGVYHLIYSRDPQRARADFLAAISLRPGHAEARSFLQYLEEQERSPDRDGVARR